VGDKTSCRLEEKKKLGTPRGWGPAEEEQGPEKGQNIGGPNQKKSQKKDQGNATLTGHQIQGKKNQKRT